MATEWERATMKFASSLSIANKIYLGFGSVLLLLVILAIVSVLGARTSDGQFTEYRGTARQTILLSNMQEDLLEARLAVLKFRATNDPALVQEVRDNLAEIDEADATVDELVTVDEMRQALLALRDDLSIYGETFENAVQRQDQRNRFVGEMDAIGPEIRKSLTEVASSA